MDEESSYNAPVAGGGADPSWFSRNRLWIILSIVFGCILLFIGCILVFLNTLFGALNNTEPFQLSLERAEAHADVVAETGQPLERTGMVYAGSMSIKNDTGAADFTYTVRGPKGTAIIGVKGAKTAGAWSYERMDVSLPSGKIVDLTK